MFQSPRVEKTCHVCWEPSLLDTACGGSGGIKGYLCAERAAVVTYLESYIMQRSSSMASRRTAPREEPVMQAVPHTFDS